MIGVRQQVRVARARARARALLESVDATTDTLARRDAAALREQLPSRFVVDDSPDVVVTECGFVTMAILCRRARRFERALTVPGVDDRGRRGFLVLCAGQPPFHSLAAEAETAVNEAIVARTRAAALLAGFGDRERLRAAVRAAPWYRRTTFADTERAGLCRWGSESFLRRLGLHAIAMRVGVPCALLRLAGGYGERAVAATLLRHATERSDGERVARRGDAARVALRRRPGRA